MSSTSKHLDLSIWFAYNWHKVLLVFVTFSFLNQKGYIKPFATFTQGTQNHARNQVIDSEPGLGSGSVTQRASARPLTVQQHRMDASPMALLGVKPASAISTSEKQSLDFSESEVIAFLDRFADVARNEHHRYGIPASVILSAALLHSKAGTADAATTANNFFSLPCTTDWIGPQRQVEGQCLRKYETAWLSFRDNTLFLTSGRFADLKERFDPNDYKSWCMEIEERGYPGGKKVGQLMIALIERYQLTNWD